MSHSYRQAVSTALPLILLILALAPAAQGQTPAAFQTSFTDSCSKLGARECAQLALDAMGGRDRLEGLKNIRTETVEHTSLMEQSYRQDPFITSYRRTHESLGLAGQRLVRDANTTWPESDIGKSENHSTLEVSLNCGVYRGRTADRACSVADIDELRETLSLEPARLLLTALQSSDLHFDKPEMLRSTPHAVLAFTWNKVAVKILLNSLNHLPDAVETVQAFRDLWRYCGDVRQRSAPPSSTPTNPPGDSDPSNERG